MLRNCELFPGRASPSTFAVDFLKLACGVNRDNFIKRSIGLSVFAAALVVAGSLQAATAEELAAHIQNLRQKVPAEVYTIVSQPPFVVIGNEPAEVVRDRASNTIG